MLNLFKVTSSVQSSQADSYQLRTKNKIPISKIMIFCFFYHRMRSPLNHSNHLCGLIKTQKCNIDKKRHAKM